ncbi:MAG: hypothetical protein MZV49_05615 [Rhodopseudomonas palustris]|nr:hypothetical protein [Rhodopseudomonas palustris]
MISAQQINQYAHRRADRAGARWPRRSAPAAGRRAAPGADAGAWRPTTA